MKALLITLTLLFASPFTSAEPATTDSFDHQHSLWNSLLQRHVHWIEGGVASQVDYHGFKKDRASLDRYLATLSDVDRDAFDRWSRDQRKAFLLNGYNAFTVKLILSKYPDVESIKDLGSFFSSPWSKQFFLIFGKQTSLDTIEHEMLRKPGAYDDPYIHIAVICASIGCPALPNEAFRAGDIDRQLKRGMQRFLSDRSRNRFNPQSGRLEVSKVFDWYEADFEQGDRGIHSLKGLLSRYAAQLSDNPHQQLLIGEHKLEIDHLDYDWRLNDYSHKLEAGSESN
ncbi:MAG: DUF547 domain-containing protein [Gammaproteobacteria bacterium]|nr:DUF547 domain-containing protein [Gammaproteobacteria bacterium]